LPVLRKDFMLEPVQVWESRAAGADAVLLIVRALGEAGLAELLGVAAEAGLGALVEVHDQEELGRALDAGAPVIGVNNRDLRTFATTLEVTEDLAAAVPGERILVSESGIESGADVARLGALGVDAVLVGRALVTHADPVALGAELAGQARVERA
jgi:indole-3-glycerol phosphate synthase